MLYFFSLLIVRTTVRVREWLHSVKSFERERLGHYTEARKPAVVVNFDTKRHHMDRNLRLPDSSAAVSDRTSRKSKRVKVFASEATRK